MQRLRARRLEAPLEGGGQVAFGAGVPTCQEGDSHVALGCPHSIHQGQRCLGSEQPEVPEGSSGAGEAVATQGKGLVEPGTSMDPPLQQLPTASGEGLPLMWPASTEQVNSPQCSCLGWVNSPRQWSKAQLSAPSSDGPTAPSAAPGFPHQHSPGSSGRGQAWHLSPSALRLGWCGRRTHTTTIMSHAMTGIANHSPSPPNRATGQPLPIDPR